MRRGGRRAGTPVSRRRARRAESRAGLTETRVMYLGIDLGTSEVKALLIDAQQNIVATAHAALAISRPQPLWSEQDPADWWRATLAAVGDDRAPASARDGGAARHRPVRPDARHGAAGRRRPGAAAGDFVERHALRFRVRGTGGARAAAARHHRQRGDAGLLRAQAVVGRAARAGGLQAHGEGAAAEGLSALSADRRIRLRHVRRIRHAVAGRRPARLVATHAGRLRA